MKRVLLASVLVAACGDDGGVIDRPDAQAPDADVGAPDAWPDDGFFDDPSDFPRDGCEPGGFAGVDLQQIYHLRATDGDYSTVPDTMRLDDNGDGTWGGIMGWQAITDVRANDSDVIVRALTEFGIHAVDLCARAADGTLHGHAVICNAQGAECTTGTLTGKQLLPLPEPEADGFTVLGEYGPWPSMPFDTGTTVNVRVRGDVAYLARYVDGLRILDISDPANIVELGHLPVGGGDWQVWNDVKIAEGPAGKVYALMSSSANGLIVVDVTDPTAPALVRAIGDGDNHTSFVDGTRLYFTNSNIAGVDIWDITDPASPTKLGEYASAGGYPHDLYASGDRLYLNAFGRGMDVVDVSNPAQPQVLGTYQSPTGASHSTWVTTIDGRRIAVHGDEGWGAHLTFVDVTEDASFLDELAAWETRPEVSAHNVMASGTRAYAAYYQDGVRVLDIADPANPVPIAHYRTWPGYDRDYGFWMFEGALGIDLDLARGRIYVADSHRGLIILQLTR